MWFFVIALQFLSSFGLVLICRLVSTNVSAPSSSPVPARNVHPKKPPKQSLRFTLMQGNQAC
jgi:hypothetical protein